MSTTLNAKSFKTKKTYLAKVISVKYVEVSPYTYNKLNSLKPCGYKDEWINKIVQDPAIKSSEKNLCFANECGDHINNMYWYDSATDEQKTWQKKENKKEYGMVRENGYYGCSCFRE
tara:strand:+ start:141 stop:491 length:351 start_codon:yes stop_codon:yes gene_type:complete